MQSLSNRRSENPAILVPTRREDFGVHAETQMVQDSSPTRQHRQVKETSGSWPAENFLTFLAIGLFALLVFFAAVMSS